MTRIRKPAGPVVEGWKDDALTVWVPGRPANMKNKVGHWSTRAKWAKGWRARAAAHLAFSWSTRPVPFNGKASEKNMGWPWAPEEPKRVTFTIYGPSRFDDDNCALVASPCRDALQDMRIIDNDGNPAHRFLYEQATPTRKAGAAHGIAIKVELA